MPEEREYSSKIRPLFQIVNTHGDVPSFFASIKDLHYPLLLLYAAHFCLSEVYNGGFLQLFWNSTGVLLPEAVEGYRALGMPKLAATFASAASGSPYPRDREERWDALLTASMHTEDELARIFERAENLYLGYEEAIANLPIAALNREAWELAKSENSGFQERAVSYAAML